jgi:hypothetical protein
MIPEVVSIAKAKAHLSELVREAKADKVFEVINRSQPMAIIGKDVKLWNQKYMKILYSCSGI